jgi:predicted PP-loop superfamily ATPase
MYDRPTELNGGLPIHHLDGRIICDNCYSLESNLDFPRILDKSLFKKEFEEYIQNNKTLVFAYSGGLDSTVVLHELNQITRERKLNLLVFTIDHGFKGEKTRQNIQRVLEFECLEGVHKSYPLSEEVDEKSGKRVVELYCDCIRDNVLPCGEICNRIMDEKYRKILKNLEQDVLITGGDTPILDRNGHYSIFWDKKSGIKVLRAGVLFCQSKNSNKNYLREKNIPWEEPLCGGYDTDCLLPGSILASIMKSNPPLSPEETLQKFPIIINYLSERVRFGIIDRKKAIESLSKIDLADFSSFIETMKLYRKYQD